MNTAQNLKAQNQKENEKEKLIRLLKQIGIFYTDKGNRILIFGAVMGINKNEIEILQNISTIRIIENAESYRIIVKKITKTGEIEISKNAQIKYKHPDLIIDL